MTPTQYMQFLYKVGKKTHHQGMGGYIPIIKETWRSSPNSYHWHMNTNYYLLVYTDVIQHIVIRTFKNHLITGLCMCNTWYSSQEWVRLIPHAQLTLNLLRSSRCHLSMSTYTSVWKNLDFNARSVAPPGTKVSIHDKLQKRGTYGVHGINAWCIGPNMNHYRCYTWYVPVTGGTRFADTVKFSPSASTFSNYNPWNVSTTNGCQHHWHLTST